MSQSPPPSALKTTLKRIPFGQWMVLAAVLLYGVTLFLPWVIRSTYFASMSFPFSEAITGKITHATEVLDPVNWHYSGAELVESPSLGPNFINLTLVTLATTILSFALVWPIIFLNNAGLKMAAAIPQLVLSVVGWIPFFFMPTILRFFEAFDQQKFPEEPLPHSVLAYGFFLAGAAAVILSGGAWITVWNLREQKRMRKARSEMENSGPTV